MADVFDQAAKDTKPSKQRTAQASAPKGGDVFDQAAVTTAPTEQPQGMPLADTAWGRMKQAYEGTLPLLDENQATLAGVGSIARGGVGAVKGIYDLLRQAGRAWNDPKAEVGDVALPQPQIGQARAAIRDINASPDPAGTYLKAAGETAGQGAGAALTALATEGAARGLPKAIEAAGDVPVGRIAKATGAGLKAGAGKFPIIGPPTKAAILGAMKSWRASAPPEIPGVNPGAPLPTATPEQLNPALISPSRTLPGMNPPEVTGRPTPGPIQGPSRGLMLPGETEPPIIPASKVSTTPPKPSPVSKADILARMRSIAQQPGTGVTAPAASGQPLRIAGQDVPANADLTPGLQVPQSRVEGKIMQVLRKEGVGLSIGRDRLMDAPQLRGISPDLVQKAVINLNRQGKIWHEPTGGGAHPVSYTVALKKR